MKTQNSKTNAKKPIIGVPIVAQRLTNPTSIHEDSGSIPDLAQWVKGLVLPKMQLGSGVAVDVPNQLWP